MTLHSSSQFNSYLIAESIGVGGMGEVYRATDTRLKREVAIKVLPSDFATDAERLARFQREAELLASLNHPNIAQIFGIENADGITALVMELIDGPTLAERIEQSPITQFSYYLVLENKTRNNAYAIQIQSYSLAHSRFGVCRAPRDTRLRTAGAIR